MDDLYRQRLLLDVEDAEEVAKPFLIGVTGLEKLLVSDSFYSFGGLSAAPALSLAGVDQMSLDEKRVWIACRLWAICHKIRSMSNPPAQAGVALATYKNWLTNPGISRQAAGASGGRKPRPYGSDLDSLIEQIALENQGSKSMPQTVFNKLPGMSRGVIESINKDKIDGAEVLTIHWEGDGADRPEREQTLTRDAIRKRVVKIIK